jgi:elongation factor P
MTLAQNVVPGAILSLNGEVVRVESAMKVSALKGRPLVKVKLRRLSNDEVFEKNFKLDQVLDEVSLSERELEFLYPEKDYYLFLDTWTLDQVSVSSSCLGEKVFYLKEGTQVKAICYGELIHAIELPQFLEIMVVKTESSEMEGVKKAVLETGARLIVPMFVEAGDVLKVDTQVNEYIQRV